MHTLKHLPAGRHGAAGFSIIEALIAAAILLIIALGLLPLFSRSISDNVSGNDATQATNGSRTQVEEMLKVPFSNDRMTVPAGATIPRPRPPIRRAPSTRPAIRTRGGGPIPPATARCSGPARPRSASTPSATWTTALSTTPSRAGPRPPSYISRRSR